MAKKLGITEYYKVELKSSFIDESGFRYSPDKTRLFRAPGQLKTYILPEGVTIICDRAFMNRATYEEIDLPDSLKYIGDQAFAGCHRLKSIRIPAGVQVSENAFEGCSPLLKTEIPYIDKSSGLTTNEMPTVTDNGGEIIVNGETLVIAPKNCIDYQVPEGIVTIAAKAFYKNKKLQSVSLPKSVEVIEAQAFLGCENLSSIEFPPNIKTIGESAFSSCMSLSEISLPPRVAIRQHAFTNCRRMKFVEIGEDSTIFEGVFHECAWLKTVSIPLSVRFIKDKDIYSYRFPFLYCPSLSKERSEERRVGKEC